MSRGGREGGRECQRERVSEYARDIEEGERVVVSNDLCKMEQRRRS